MDKRGESEGVTGIIVLVAIVLIIWGVGSFFGVSFGIENEGIVKYDDCREIITLKDNSWQKYFMKFTCTYRKTQGGDIMGYGMNGGECVHIDHYNSLFSSSPACERAYVYTKEQRAGVCPSEHPYLGYGDKCYNTPQ